MLFSGSDRDSLVHTYLELWETVICGNRAFASVLTEVGTLGKGGPTGSKRCPDEMAAIQNHTRQGDMEGRMGAEVKVYWDGCLPRRRKRHLPLRPANSTDTMSFCPWTLMRTHFLWSRLAYFARRTGKQTWDS